MVYSLRRVGDEAGDCGPMSSRVRINSDTKEIEWESGSKSPVVGWAMRVGGLSSWWTTTPVTKITKDTPKEVHFKTRNSSYVWKRQ